MRTVSLLKIMKINYPQQQHKRRALIVFSLLGMSVLVLLMFVLWLGGVHVLRVAYGSLVHVRGVITDGAELVVAALSPRSTLLRENQLLRDEITSLGGLRLERDALASENAELRGIARTPSSVMARIVDYRTYPFGTLLATVETVAPIAEGDIVVSGGFALGEVHSVTDGSVVVELFTRSNKELSVLVGDSGSATYVGQSSYGEIELPRMTAVSLGEVVTLPRAHGMPIGVVAEVQSKEGDPLQTLLVEVPVQIRHLRFVTIVHE